jgi:hypothetical protein
MVNRFVILSKAKNLFAFIRFFAPLRMTNFAISLLFCGVLICHTVYANNYDYKNGYDRRYYFSPEKPFLFERTVPQTGDGSLECAKRAINTVSQTMPYYVFYYKQDIRLVENIAENISVIFFSDRLIKQSFILPSGIYASAVLYMESLLKKMCPKIQIQSDYQIDRQQDFQEYMVIKTIPVPSDVMTPQDNKIYQQIFSVPKD